ncbi:MAG TPA: sigma-70 family RNA polymerase sigma factor [Solirubrobacteraceae bacterium]|jgi:RNA polymerase sigma factor (sigma-70 family)|nr:sigma-70 family RNA polymerase sigma factor [Solirubrobacteraceae bacterium]
MSPLTLRRYRAERLLKSEFEGLRIRVLASVRRRLRSAGVDLDERDIEACYAMAWQGLYKAVLDGQEIANPAGWLVLVTFRRAIEEHRARRRVQCGGEPAGAQEPDMAGELDDRMRLRQLFEGLRGRLSEREREAAVLCYLQGLPRAQAAERMGVTETRMRKLMEGRGPGRPGVAGKVGALVETIRGGAWCEEQSSLMRGVAFGMLDPDGERHQLATLHLEGCPACRAYVVSLRGLAAALPPILLPGTLGATALAGAGAGMGVGAVATGARVGAGTQVGRGVGGALTASGTAGAGSAAGGGWMLAGGGKLALGCLLALSVGTGCVALDVSGGRSHGSHVAHRHRTLAKRVASVRADAAVADSYVSTSPAAPPRAIASSRGTGGAALAPAAKATREFGPEAQSSATSSQPTAAATPTPRAAAARVASAPSEGEASPSPTTGSSPSSAGGASQATREFSPG